MNVNSKAFDFSSNENLFWKSQFTSAVCCCVVSWMYYMSGRQKSMRGMPVLMLTKLWQQFIQKMTFLILSPLQHSITAERGTVTGAMVHLAVCRLHALWEVISFKKTCLMTSFKWQKALLEWLLFYSFVHVTWTVIFICSIFSCRFRCFIWFIN